MNCGGVEEDEEEEEEESYGEEKEVTPAEAKGALDEPEEPDEEEEEEKDEPFEESAGPAEGVSTKGIKTSDADNALGSETASSPYPEIKDHYEAYEKTAKEIEDLETEID